MTARELLLVKQHLTEALAHLNQASDILGAHTADNDVYQLWVLIPVSGVQRLLNWLKAIKPTEGTS